MSLTSVSPSGAPIVIVLTGLTADKRSTLGIPFSNTNDTASAARTAVALFAVNVTETRSSLPTLNFIPPRMFLNASSVVAD